MLGEANWCSRGPIHEVFSSANIDDVKAYVKLEKEATAFDNKFHETLDERMPCWKESYKQALMKKIKNTKPELELVAYSKTVEYSDDDLVFSNSHHQQVLVVTLLDLHPPPALVPAQLLLLLLLAHFQLQQLIIHLQTMLELTHFHSLAQILLPANLVLQLR